MAVLWLASYEKYQMCPSPFFAMTRSVYTLNYIAGFMSCNKNPSAQSYLSHSLSALFYLWLSVFRGTPNKIRLTSDRKYFLHELHEHFGCGHFNRFFRPSMLMILLLLVVAAVDNCRTFIARS